YSIGSIEPVLKDRSLLLHIDGVVLPADAKRGAWRLQHNLGSLNLCGIPEVPEGGDRRVPTIRNLADRSIEPATISRGRDLTYEGCFAQIHSRGYALHLPIRERRRLRDHRCRISSESIFQERSNHSHVTFHDRTSLAATPPTAARRHVTRECS